MKNHSTAPDPKRFAARLNETLTKAGIPDSENVSRAGIIAPECKVSRTAAGWWLSGSKTPAAIHAFALAKRYGADFCWLYFGERQNADPAPAPLSYEEEQLLERWRIASPVARQAISMLLPRTQKKIESHRTYSKSLTRRRHPALWPLVAFGASMAILHGQALRAAAPDIASASQVACTALVNTGIADRCALERHNLVLVSSTATAHDLQSRCAKIAAQLHDVAHYPDGWLVFYSPISTHPIASCPLEPSGSKG